MAGCIFCGIAEGAVSAERVYEDELVVAFMDISPVALGHVLVIPKSHSQDITEMTSQEIAAVGAAVKLLAPAVVSAVAAEGFNLLNNCGRAAGQAVDHVHFHIIPRKAGDGRGYNWLTMSYGDGEMSRIAGVISASL